jgi:inorganic triphosphatase YgiF
MIPPGELLLAVDPRRLRAIERLPLLSASGSRWVRRSVTMAYFDTPRLRLWRRGMSLAMRRSRGGWVQSLSRAGNGPGMSVRAAQARALVSGPAPDLGAMGNADLAGALGAEPSQVKLKTAFTVEIVRTSRRVAPGPGTLIDVRLDGGWIRCGKRAERVGEISLALRSGERRALFEFARRLRDTVPFVIQGRSRAERGFALRTEGRPLPVRAGPSPVAPAMTTHEAYTAIAFSCLAHLQANQLGMLHSSDSEYLHQMRVALRRLRSAIGIFGKIIPEAAWADALPEVRWLARSLGPARDLDVFVEERLPQVVTQFREEPGMAALERACAQARLRAAGRARRAVHSARCQQFLLALAENLAASEWLEGLSDLERQAVQRNVVPFAQAVLEERYRQVRRRGRLVARLSDAKLHRLRIAIKKLRYAAEFFGPLFDMPRVRQFRAGATDVQDILGRLNDAGVANAILGSIEPFRGKPRLAQARALVAGWNRHEVHQGKQDLVEVWRAFRRTRPFWR